MLCNARKRTQCTYRKEKGFAPVFLVLLAAYVKEKVSCFNMKLHKPFLKTLSALGRPSDLWVMKRYKRTAYYDQINHASQCLVIYSLCFNFEFFAKLIWKYFNLLKFRLVGNKDILCFIWFIYIIFFSVQYIILYNHIIHIWLIVHFAFPFNCKRYITTMQIINNHILIILFAISQLCVWHWENLFHY